MKQQVRTEFEIRAHREMKKAVEELNWKFVVPPPRQDQPAKECSKSEGDGG